MSAKLLNALVADLERRQLKLVTLFVVHQDSERLNGMIVVNRGDEYAWDPFVCWEFDVHYRMGVEEPVVSTFTGDYGNLDEALGAFFQRLGTRIHLPLERNVATKR